MKIPGARVDKLGIDRQVAGAERAAARAASINP